MAHGDARDGKWRGNWQMEWVASTLHTTSEHGVSSITTAGNAHLGCQHSTELTSTGWFKWTCPFRLKDEIWFLRVCHHISTGLYQKLCGLTVVQLPILQVWYTDSRIQLKCDSTRRTGGEVKGKLANAVGSQYPSHYLGTWCIQHYYHWYAHLRLSVVDWTDAIRLI